jgi:hypothetical protein
MYCLKPSCVGCENNTKERKTRAEEIVNTDLLERKAPVKLDARPLEEQAVFRSKLDELILKNRRAIAIGMIDATALEDLLNLAAQIGWQPMAIYWKLSEGRFTANVSLLSEIARIKEYKPYWIVMKRNEISERLGRKKSGPAHKRWSQPGKF